MLTKNDQFGSGSSVKHASTLQGWLEVVYLFGFALAGVIVLVSSWTAQWAQNSARDPVGLVFVPRLAGVLLLLGGAWELVKRLRAGVPSEHATSVAIGWYSIIPMIAPAIYLVAIIELGFVVTTLPSLLLLAFSSRNRSLIGLGGITIIGTAMLYLFFIVLLGTFFPEPLFF